MATEFPTYALTTEGTDAITAVTDPLYQPVDSDLTAIAALSTTAYGRALLALADQAALQTAVNVEDGADVTDETNVAAAGAPIITAGAGAPGSTPSKVGDIYIDTTGDNAYVAVGTASSADWAQVDGSGSGTVVASTGDGAPASTPTNEGDIYIDTTNDVAYVAVGSASSADWKRNIAVAAYDAGWPSPRPAAEIVIWVSTDTAATTPGAATGDDVVILAQDADLTAIAALTTAPYGRSLLETTSEANFKQLVNLEIGTDVQAYDADILKADTADTLTVGFNSSDYAAGTKSSGTYTPDPANGNFQVATNGGAHTLAPPATTCSIVIHYTNNGSAGTITTSGFTMLTGDDFTVTDTHEFVCVVTKINDVSVLNITALQ